MVQLSTLVPDCFRDETNLLYLCPILIFPYPESFLQIFSRNGIHIRRRNGFASLIATSVQQTDQTYGCISLIFYEAVFASVYRVLKRWFSVTRMHIFHFLSLQLKLIKFHLILLVLLLFVAGSLLIKRKEI